MPSEVEVWLPPDIADVQVGIDPQVVARMESALREVAALDAEHGTSLEALGTLLRTLEIERGLQFVPQPGQGVVRF